MADLSCCSNAAYVSTAPAELWRRPRRFQVACAASSGSTRRMDKEKRRSRDEPRKSYRDEEVYNVHQGWKIKPGKDEKLMEIAGLQFPASLNKLQKTEQESVKDEEPRSVHKLLKVMGGKVSGKKLLSSSGMSVRPMMEVVRGAVFNMLQSRGGYSGGLPPGRWLDLYSGTGSVGIEALSRGCISAHFIELDPWVVANVLEPNLKATNFMEQSVIHKTRVEKYLEKHSSNRKAQPFDYISVTPPYELVHYPTLMDQLSSSPLVAETTTVIVEYPLKSKNEMPEACGPLSKIIDRRYGRTHLAIYGPSR